MAATSLLPHPGCKRTDCHEHFCEHPSTESSDSTQKKVGFVASDAAFVVDAHSSGHTPLSCQCAQTGQPGIWGKWSDGFDRCQLKRDDLNLRYFWGSVNFVSAYRRNKQMNIPVIQGINFSVEWFLLESARIGASGKKHIPQVSS
jgi:hypothetical protein